MNVGENIKRLRIERGLSQTDLAKLTGYKDKTAISRIEKGTNDLTQSKVMIFATALNVSPAVIMGWDNEPDLSTPETDAAISNDEEFKELYSMYQTLTESQKGLVREMINQFNKGNKGGE